MNEFDDRDPPAARGSGGEVGELESLDNLLGDERPAGGGRRPGPRRPRRD
jgi:hypothetical protein